MRMAFDLFVLGLLALVVVVIEDPVLKAITAGLAISGAYSMGRSRSDMS